MSRIGLGLCIAGGAMIIIPGAYFCGLETSLGPYYGLAGACSFFLILLIFGAFGIAGGITGWKWRKEGYLFSIVGGFIGVIWIPFIFYLGSFIGMMAILGAIFILVGGIYGYIDARRS
jgi:hypothetical protein